MIITDPPQYAYRRGPATLQGLNGQFSKSAITSLAAIIFDTIKQLRPLMEKYRAEVRRSDPWWEENFGHTAEMFYGYWESIRVLPESADFDKNYSDLLKTNENYQTLLARLKQIDGLAVAVERAVEEERKRAAKERRSPTPPPPLPELPPIKKDVPPEVGGSSGMDPMLIGGIVLGIAAIGIFLAQSKS